MPSLSSSPWILVAPHRGFSKLICRRRTVAAACGAVVATCADRRIDPAVSRRLVFLCLHGRGARHSSWHCRRYDGAVRTAGDSRVIGHDAAVGRHDAHGKHAGLAAVPHEGDQPDAAFRRFAQDVLYRGADLSIVWPEILATAAIGAVYF